MANLDADGVVLDVALTGAGEVVRTDGVVLDLLVMGLEITTPTPPLQGQPERRKTHLQGRSPGIRRGPGPLI